MRRGENISFMPIEGGNPGDPKKMEKFRLHPSKRAQTFVF
jgi:hypothetical protein